LEAPTHGIKTNHWFSAENLKWEEEKNISKKIEKKLDIYFYLFFL
jgi:hypothetical protein